VPVALVLAGCGATGPSNGSSGGAEPAGWIYGFAINTSRTARVNARTGTLEEISWPAPPVRNDKFLFEGNVSPIDGDLAQQGDTGWGWPRTFVLDAASGAYRDFDPPEVAAEEDFRWSPDGSQVIFLRHAVQGDTRRHLVRLTVATGIVDTLLTPDQAAGLLSAPFWIGSDTVGVTIDERPQVGDFPYHYVRIATATRAVAPYDELPWTEYHVPLISADRQWLAHWVVRDSAPPGGEATEFAMLRLGNRMTGDEQTLVGFPAWTTYEGSISIAFSPDSRFIASCRTDTEVTIFAVATGSVVKRLPLPYCRIALNWSWGPEGAPAN